MGSANVNYKYRAFDTSDDNWNDKERPEQDVRLIVNTNIDKDELEDIDDLGDEVDLHLSNGIANKKINTTILVLLNMKINTAHSGPNQNDEQDVPIFDNDNEDSDEDDDDEDDKNHLIPEDSSSSGSSLHSEGNNNNDNGDDYHANDNESDDNSDTPDTP